MYNFSDEAFTSGTMGELARVSSIDKRKIENKGNLLEKIQSIFHRFN